MLRVCIQATIITACALAGTWIGLQLDCALYQPGDQVMRPWLLTATLGGGTTAGIIFGALLAAFRPFRPHRTSSELGQAPTE